MAEGRDVFADDDDSRIDAELEKDVDSRIDAELEKDGPTIEDQGDDDAAAAAPAGDDDNIEIIIDDGGAEEEPVTQEGADDAPAEGDDAAAADDDAAGGDDEAQLKKEGYGKSVRDRIMRERRLVKKAREEADSRVAAEVGKRLEAERTALKANSNLTATLLHATEQQITAAKAALTKAKEDGDTKAEVEGQEKLNDLQLQKRELEGAKKQLETAAAEFEDRAKTEQASSSSGPVPKAQAWLDRNRWFGSDAFKAESLMVRTIDRDLAAKKMDKNSDDYYRELDRRIKAEMPDIGTKIARHMRTEQGGGKRVRTAVAGAQQQNGARQQQTGARPGPGGKQQVRITQADMAAMREFKLDPHNPAHVKEWARNKVGA